MDFYLQNILKNRALEERMRQDIYNLFDVVIPPMFLSNNPERSTRNQCLCVARMVWNV